MMAWFIVLTLIFVVVSIAMTLIILVQRPQGGGLAGAFGGAGGGGTDTVFGGRVGDALTWATVIAFSVYLLLAIALNKIDPKDPGTSESDASAASIAPADDPSAPPLSDPSVPLIPTPPPDGP